MKTEKKINELFKIKGNMKKKIFCRGCKEEIPECDYGFSKILCGYCLELCETEEDIKKLEEEYG